MLDFVNQFRLVIVGGIDSLQGRMEDAGFTNFYIIASKYSNSGIEANGDFFCVCSKFISHQDVYAVESQHKDQLNRFFYFNGTNVNVLLRVCYDFMKSCLDRDGLGS